MKELGASLLTITLLCVLAVTARATTRTMSEHPRGVIGVCADYEERHRTTSLHFCAKQDKFNEIFYYFSINVTTSLREHLIIDNDVLNIKQAISKRVVPLRFEASTVVIVSEDPNVFLKSYVVEIPKIVIRHIRNGIPVDFYFSIAGKLYEYNLTPQERSEVRMVALFAALQEE